MALSHNSDSMTTIKHHAPSLSSTLIGELDGDVALFRGIPYAIVDKRWTHSKVRNQLEPSFDTTKFAPRCPQPVTSIMVTGGTPDPVPGDDEFACLNLCVSVSKENLASDSTVKKLPVLVWIHGGSFISGSNSVARYRPKRLIDYANTQNSPVIIVSINYRLGALGFISSQDLINEASQTGEHAGNFGFLDQRNAFIWVEQHIQDFGGDPNNVTAIGVSAGAACIHHHMLSGQKLFDRAVLMSGTAGTLGPLPLELFEKQWQIMTKACGLQDLDVNGRLGRLRQMPAEDLISAFGRRPLGVWDDTQIFPEHWKLGDTYTNGRCKSIMVGDVRMEGIILDAVSQHLPQGKFFQLIQQHFPRAEDQQKFCSSFGWTFQSEMPITTYRDGLRMFFSVAIFQYPALRTVETSTIPTYHYHFEQPAPFSGPTQGHAYHGQCAAYFHMNLTQMEGFDQGSTDVGTTMAGLWIDFANGKAPWDSYKNKKYMRFGPDGTSSVQDLESDTVRPQGYLPWIHEHWPAVQELCRTLLYRI